MPYIAERMRGEIDNIQLDREGANAAGPGTLNYLFTIILNSYFHAKGGNYQAVNDIIGALEGAKLEFYRRIAAPYEDTKIKENGDVY